MSNPNPHNHNIMLPPIGNVGNVSSMPSMMTMANPSIQQQPAMQQQQTPIPTTFPQPRPPPPPLDTMRAYRACLNCRNRKSKCDLDVNQGRPPCRRCQRENKECILGESHRGGRRVRKKPKEEGEATKPAAPSTPSTSSSKEQPQYSPVSAQQPLPSAPIYHNGYGDRQDRYGWQQSATAGSDSTNRSRDTQHNLLNSPLSNPQYRPRAQSTIGITSIDLQNPSDALEILAQVADRAEDGSCSSGSERLAHIYSSQYQRQKPNPVKPSEGPDSWNYKPYQEGLITTEIIYNLFQHFRRFFHPFFPISPLSTFNPAQLPHLSYHSPHLFSAILTVASKDDERIHQVCYDHMQTLISAILSGSEAGVEAVEAFLILSQWVSHRPQSSIPVGRGEEDRVAWMYIGTALRLGYYLGIDRTSFRDGHSIEDPALFNRRRLCWAMCYMCDRQVSVRAGKGFWARGPGPLSGLRASDFPTLQPTNKDEDDFSQVFQANLELTQIFSNVHDILYSSKGHGWEEMLQGRYAKYLDDFRTSIRSWYEAWSPLRCSRYLKASLMLTYDYLRLYVNAFAYQATISRALTQARGSQHRPGAVPLLNATTPDARFIYEALDAAQSLLSNVVNYVEAETLRYMPSSYYLYIIYSAVFLYKARVTTTMTDEERMKVRNLVEGAVKRLQESGGEGGSGMGVRYARLLLLLWRKTPRKGGHGNGGGNGGYQPHGTHGDVLQRQSLDGLIPDNPNQQSQDGSNNPNNGFDPYNSMNFQNQNQTQNQNQNRINTSSGQGSGTGAQQGFSWLDLPSAWNYATDSGHHESGSAGGSGGFESGGELGSPFEVGGHAGEGLLGDIGGFGLLSGMDGNGEINF